MVRAVYIDSCAWDYLYQNKVDLCTELPSLNYRICITREVEIELAAISDFDANGIDKRGLKAYIRKTIERSKVKTTSVFGFMTYEPDGSPSKVQVYGGYGQGTFQSNTEKEFYASPEVQKQLRGKARRNSGLGSNQADASLAVHASHAVVITNEDPNKTGPLRLASERGWKVVYLKAQVETSGLSLGQYIASLF